jgi:hypothetical protein
MNDFNKDKTQQQNLLFNITPPATSVSSALYLHSVDEVQPVDLLRVPKPKIENRYALPSLPHDQICNRVHEKRVKVLTFLADGEIFSTMKILSHVLELSVRQTQATLAGMVDDGFLKFDDIDGLRLYGITPTGHAYLQTTKPGRAFEIGKTHRSTITHHLVSQKIRIELVKYYDVQDFVPGKLLFKSTELQNVPDGLFRVRRKKVGNEIELTVKSAKNMKVVLGNYSDYLGEINDETAYLHKVVYFTPYVKPVTELINRFVPPELRRQFFVCHTSTEILPHRKEVFHTLDKGLYHFLMR